MYKRQVLHVPKIELANILQKMCNAVKVGGIIYTSFKYGNFEIAKKWTMPIRNWGKVRGELEIMYPCLLYTSVPIIDKIDVQKKETQELIGKMFSGSRTKFLSCFLSQDDVSDCLLYTSRCV